MEYRAILNLFGSVRKPITCRKGGGRKPHADKLENGEPFCGCRENPASTLHKQSLYDALRTEQLISVRLQQLQVQSSDSLEHVDCMFRSE